MGRAKKYTFAELSECAKDKVRRHYEVCDFDVEYVLDDAMRMGALLGISIDTKERTFHSQVMWKKIEPSIHYSVGSYDDYCSIAATYRYAKGAGKAIQSETNDPELQRIADGLEALQFANEFDLYAKLTHGRERQDVDVETGDEELDQDTFDHVEDVLSTLLRDFTDWILKQLQAEYEYRYSDEAIANFDQCYTFEGDEYVV